MYVCMCVCVCVLLMTINALKDELFSIHYYSDPHNYLPL